MELLHVALALCTCDGASVRVVDFSSSLSVAMRLVPTSCIRFSCSTATSNVILSFAAHCSRQLQSTSLHFLRLTSSAMNFRTARPVVIASIASAIVHASTQTCYAIGNCRLSVDIGTLSTQWCKTRPIPGVTFKACCQNCCGAGCKPADFAPSASLL